MKPSRRTSRSELVALAVGLLIFFVEILLITAQTSPAHSVRKSPSAIATAKAQIAKGDLQAAETSLWSVLSSKPDDDEALALLGTVRLRQQRVPEAEALYKRVLQINPKNGPAQRTLAGIFAVEGKTSEAIQQLQMAASVAPNDIPLKVELAQLYGKTSQFEQAVTTLESIPQSKFPLGAVPIKAAALVAVGRRGDAIKLVEIAKASPAVEVELAEVFVDGNLPDEALACLDLASGDAKRLPPRFYYLRGRALAAKGEFDPALAALQQASAEDPKSAETLDALAELYARQNKRGDAVKALQKAHGLAPNSLPILRHLVAEAARAGDKHATLDSAAELSDKSPNDADDLYLAGAAMLEQNGQAAAATLEAYVTLRPDDAKGQLALGMAYVQLEHFTQARKALERSLKLDPKQGEAEYQLALVAKGESKLNEAIEHLQRALDLQPKHLNALRMVGNLYLQTGELEKAKDALERAESADAYSSQTEYDLALVYNKLGEKDLAKQHMDKFRKLKGQ